MDQVQYWDVFPKSMRVSKSDAPIDVPLTARGNPRGTVQFESNDPVFASVSPEGVVTMGATLGACEIVAYDSENKDSVRYVRVEVVDYGESDIRDA